MLETWLKLEKVMVQSLQDISQWLLVAEQIMEPRKCISERYYIFFYSNIFSTDTELWEFDSLENQIIDPILSYDYQFGIGLFLVDKKYCSKN